MRSTVLALALSLAAACAPAVEPESATPASESGASETTPAPASESTETTTVPAPTEEPRGPRGTRGTVVLEDFWMLGQPTSGGPSGRFEIESAASEETTSIAFTDGAWEAELDPNQLFTVTSLEIDGETVVVTGGAEFSTHKEREHAISVERSGKRTVHVVDAATGAELTEVRVVATSLVYAALYPDGASTPLFDQPVASPVVIDPAWPRRIHVTAPGYTWSSIALHASLAGEPTLALARSGAIEVRLVGEVAQSGYRLRVRQGDVAIAELPADTDRYLALDSLPAGDYELSVESGEWVWPCVLGTAEATVVGGERAECTLEIEPEPLPALVRVAASVAIAPEWGITKAEVELRLQSGEFAGLPESEIYKYKRLPLKLAEDGTFGFNQRLMPGRYEVTLLPAGHFHTILELDPGALDDWKFRVPAPGTLNVRVTSAEGEPVSPERIWWDFIDRDGYPHGSVTPNEDGVYELRVPQTSIVLRSGDPDWRITPREVAVGPETEVVLVAAPAEALLLVWEDRNMNPLRLDPWWRPSLTPSAPGGVYMTRAPGGYRIALEEPGEYVLQLPPIDGFAPFPPRTIVVHAGESLEVRVPSLRAK